MRTLSRCPLSQAPQDGIVVLHTNPHWRGIERKRNVTLGTLFKLPEAPEVPSDELLVGYREAGGFWLGD